MSNALGCSARRQELMNRLGVQHPLLLADPLNLRYLANAYVDPFSYGADFGGFLIVHPDGKAKLIHDSRLPKSFAANAHVDDIIAVPWYDGKSAGVGNRRTSLQSYLSKSGSENRIHDSLNDPLAAQLWDVVTLMRRSKYEDEIITLQRCMDASKVGHDWARTHVEAGMTELDVYNGIFAVTTKYVGTPVVVYGDFAVSPGSSKRGGGPTNYIIQNGDMLILDYSVIIDGYRSDYTNTLVVGGRPSVDQKNLFDACYAAMQAGESLLTAGASCQSVYDAVRGAFAKVGFADAFPHHAGHGLGLSHPEAPFFVQNSSESLVIGDVVTLEPGIYVDHVGGIRIEHNYRITANGFERLSHHTLSLN